MGLDILLFFGFLPELIALGLMVLVPMTIAIVLLEKGYHKLKCAKMYGGQQRPFKAMIIIGWVFAGIYALEIFLLIFCPQINNEIFFAIVSFLKKEIF